MLVQKLITIDLCLIAKVFHILSLYKTYGILRQEEEEEKKKNQNKNNSFSASLKRAEKPTRGYLSVCKTDQMAFPALDYLASYRISIKLDCL